MTILRPTIILVIFILTLAYPTSAKDESVSTWILEFDFEVTSMVTDDIGNIYVCGAYPGRAEERFDLDPGPGLYGVNPTGVSNTFIGKFNTDGELLWAKTWEADSADDLDIDTDGNVIVFGTFSGICDFNPSGESQIYTSVNEAGDFYAILFNQEGNLLWLQTWSAGGDSSAAVCVAFDINSNIYAGGNFEGTIVFDSNDKLTNLEASDPFGSFVCKLSPDGTLSWAVGLDITETEAESGITDICVTSDSGVVAAVTSYGLTGDPLIYWRIDHQFESRCFDINKTELVRITPDGIVSWSRTFNGISIEGLDRAEEGIIACGYFQGQDVDFDPDPEREEFRNSTMMNANGLKEFDTTDPFVMELDESGNLVYATTWEGHNFDRPEIIFDVIAEQNGNIYGAGIMAGENHYNHAALMGTDYSVVHAGTNADILGFYELQLPYNFTAFAVSSGIADSVYVLGRNYSGYHYKFSPAIGDDENRVDDIYYYLIKLDTDGTFNYEKDDWSEWPEYPGN